MNPVRHLARYLREGGPVRDDHWPELLRTADRFQLGPALWVALAPSRGGVAPTREEIVLQRAHLHNVTRIADLMAQCDAVVGALGGAGIRAVPLKGADALRNGRYPRSAARTMTDVDVLVPDERADAAEVVLDELGYVIQPAPDSPHQRPPRSLPGRLGSIELHTGLLVPRWAAALDPAAVLSRAAGGQLDRTDAAVHLIAHAQLQDEAYLLGQVPLRALHETALLLDGDEQVDWDRALAAFDRVGRRKAAMTHLALVASLFAVEPPVRLTPGARARAAAVTAAARRPWMADLAAQVGHAPRTLAPARMTELHPGVGLSQARLTHLGRGLRGRWGKLWE